MKDYELGYFNWIIFATIGAGLKSRYQDYNINAVWLTQQCVYFVGYIT